MADRGWRRNDGYFLIICKGASRSGSSHGISQPVNSIHVVMEALFIGIGAGYTAALLTRFVSSVAIEPSACSPCLHVAAHAHIVLDCGFSGVGAVARHLTSDGILHFIQQRWVLWFQFWHALRFWQLSFEPCLVRLVSQDAVYACSQLRCRLSNVLVVLLQLRLRCWREVVHSCKCWINRTPSEKALLCTHCSWRWSMILTEEAESVVRVNIVHGDWE